MAKPISLNKRELEKKRQGKRLEKLQRKEERKANKGNGTFEDMIAYVDENGVITDTQPDPIAKTDMDDIEVSVSRKEDIEEKSLQGRVEYFNADKGYGFIKNNGNAQKYFFHISNAPASIAEGAMVMFELERGQKGMNAVNIVFVK